MTDAELKPCPFCGGKAEVLELPDLDKPSGWTIRCCHVDDFAYESTSKEQCVNLWNTRADTQPAPEQPIVQESARDILSYLSATDECAVEVLVAGVSAMFPDGWELNQRMKFERGLTAALRALSEQEQSE